MLIERVIRLLLNKSNKFPGITVGGGFAGGAGESSSYKYGWFDQTINWVETILANGDVAIASAGQNQDLFQGAAASLGTFGVTTLLEIRLINSKTYVGLTYFAVSDCLEAVKKINAATRDISNDYIGGIMFSKQSGVVITGRLTNNVRAGVRVQRFYQSQDPWFFLHAKDLTSKSANTITEARKYDNGSGTFDRLPLSL
ncbi:hypothetical protein MMC13_001171 [Lambiella insularis]|nr:hypothetical protein [Lambiella insularis]